MKNELKAKTKDLRKYMDQQLMKSSMAVEGLQRDMASADQASAKYNRELMAQMMRSQVSSPEKSFVSDHSFHDEKIEVPICIDGQEFVLELDQI